MGHINIRSLLGKLEDLICIIDKGKLCVLCVSETWLNPFVSSNMIEIAGYDLFRHDRTMDSGKMTGGGVCIYVHKKYNTISREDLNACMPDVEICWILLMLKDTRPTAIGYVYRPPDGNVDNALDIIEANVLTVRSEGSCDIVLLGDYNIDVLKPQSVPAGKYSDFMKRLSMSSLIRCPTYFQGAYKSSIDDILVSNTDYYCASGTVHTGDTDHALIYCTRKKAKLPSMPSYIYGRTFRKFNPINFQRDCIFC